MGTRDGLGESGTPLNPTMQQVTRGLDKKETPEIESRRKGQVAQEPEREH